MNPDNLTDLARAILSDDGIRTFSDKALWFAGESQKPTAIPALVATASLSLLVVVGWLWTVTRLWRWWRASSSVSP